MFHQTTLRNAAVRSPSLLGLANQLQPQRSAASGGAESPESESPPLNLPQPKRLTPAEQRACFYQTTATAGRFAPPAGEAASFDRLAPHRRSLQLAQRCEGITASKIRDALARADASPTPSFAGGLPAKETMQIAALARACEQVLSRPDAHTALQYSGTAGLRELREAVASFLPYPVDPDHVLITAGAQQAIFLAAMAFINPGAPVLVGTPTYLGALKAFEAFQAKLVGIECDQEGMLPASLEARIKGAGLIYIQPNFQNPTGHCMSEERRAQIMKIATQAGVVVVEDDAYGRLWFEGPPPPPLTAYSPKDSIYVSTFSKFLSLPGVRLGYMVIESPRVRKMVEMIKEVADLQSSTLGQRLLIEMMRDGAFRNHLPEVRAYYKGNRDAMLAALQREMAGLGVSWNRPPGGMFVWAILPSGMSATALLARALERDVCFIPGREFYASEPDDRTLRLSFATPNHEQIASGIAALAEALREMQEDARLALAEKEPQAVS